MEHKAAIQPQITVFSALNARRACVYREKAHARGRGGGVGGGGAVHRAPGGRGELFGARHLALVPPLALVPRERMSDSHSFWLLLSSKTAALLSRSDATTEQKG